MIYFVDFEASSLQTGSFPIEVAWVGGDGHAESYLIRPAQEWLNPYGGMPVWDPDSERIHGIPLATLLSDGTDHRHVAERAERALCRRSAMSFCDSPGMDGYWLDALLRAGGSRRTVPLVHVRQLYSWACRPLHDLLPLGDGPDRDRAEERVRNLAREIVERAEEEELARHRVRHRAGPDAEGLWRTWRAVQAGVADWLAQERAR